MRRQRGLSLIGLIFVGFVLVFVALLGMKTFPPLLDYFTVVKHLRELSRGSNGDSQKDIVTSFNNRMLIDNISAVNGSDIEFEKTDGGSFRMSVAYEQKVALFGPVSLCFDFVATSGN
ncbi:MAG: DUF4845 domain-containing protein [Burkholderiales bacterium]|jgi:hypothetical protein|nr:DUF4845 domain-containing protein [Burkholderiales bacterium]